MKNKSKAQIINSIEKLEKEKWPKYFVMAVLLYIGVSFLRDEMIAVNPDNQDGVIFAYVFWIITFVFPIALKLDINSRLKKLNKDLENILKFEKSFASRPQVMNNNQYESKLKKLKDLFDQELITEEEYKIKKQEILNEL